MTDYSYSESLINIRQRGYEAEVWITRRSADVFSQKMEAAIKTMDVTAGQSKLETEIGVKDETRSKQTTRFVGLLTVSVKPVFR